MNVNQKKRLYILLSALREEIITDEQFSELDNLILSDKEIAKEYISYIKLWSDLQFFQVASQGSVIKPSSGYDVRGAEMVMDSGVWKALAETEKNAPTVQVEKVSEVSKVVIQKIERHKTPRQISKSTWVSIIISAAAILFIVLFSRFAPPKSGTGVATLLDSINAKWINTDVPIKKGDRFIAGSSYSLSREGFAKLLFDNSAVVTIEGPAEFQIVAEDRVKLQYGRLYSIVSQEALGFSVDTPSAMIIDLGTQFGVQVDFQGDTQLHVIQGKTTLIAGKSKNKISLEVHEGSAQKINGMTSDVSEIPCKESIFVRQINSDKNLIWRGQKIISLADIVGGGDGFGTGSLEKGIDLLTGGIIEKANCEARDGGGKYLPVPQNRYIDGVFVPNYQGTSVCVTSQGHVFEECPATNNLSYTEVANSRVDGFPPLWNSAILENPIYGSDICPCISLHANSGITFDLNAIRADFMGAEITRFVAGAGLSPVIIRKGNVDIWVLVDGKVRFCQKRISEAGKSYPITVELQASDRFLTLITTDGEDKDSLEPTQCATDSDWGIIVQPRLELRVQREN